MNAMPCSIMTFKLHSEVNVKKLSSAISGGFGKKRVDKTASKHLKQAALPLVFHTEGSQENDILRQSKVDATMFDHLIARGQTLFRRMRNHQLMRSSPAMRGFSGEVKNTERLWCLASRAGRVSCGGASRITEKARCCDRAMIIK